MYGVFLIGNDWALRALLRAQLIEEGVPVDAFETLSDAKRAMDVSGDLPSLILADLSSSDQPDRDADALALLAAAAPVWIIAGRTVKISNNLSRRGFEKTLLKPLDARELVEQIKQRLARK